MNTDKFEIVDRDFPESQEQLRGDCLKAVVRNKGTGVEYVFRQRKDGLHVWRSDGSGINGDKEMMEEIREMIVFLAKSDEARGGWPPFAAGLWPVNVGNPLGETSRR